MNVINNQYPSVSCYYHWGNSVMAYMQWSNPDRYGSTRLIAKHNTDFTNSNRDCFCSISTWNIFISIQVDIDQMLNIHLNWNKYIVMYLFQFMWILSKCSISTWIEINTLSYEAMMSHSKHSGSLCTKHSDSWEQRIVISNTWFR